MLSEKHENLTQARKSVPQLLTTTITIVAVRAVL